MRNFYRFLDTFGIGVILVLICLVFYFLTDNFHSSNNLRNILIQSTVNIIIATGMTFVISAAEIDLSVGSLLALCGMCTAFLMQVDPETQMNLPMYIAHSVLAYFPDLFPGSIAWWLVAGSSFLILALLPGILAGCLTGFIVVYFSLPSFIVTLGFMWIYRGFARYLTNSSPVIGLHPGIIHIGTGSFEIFGFKFYYSLLIALFIVLLGIFLLSYTRFGRHVLATGGNQQASYLSGVPVKRTRFLVFVFSGFCVAVASIIQTSRLFIGDPNAGEGFELYPIAAVIIGGTSLFGGTGTVIGTIFGALIISVLSNGLVLMDVTNHIQLIIIGSIVILAVLLNQYRRRLYYGQ